MTLVMKNKFREDSDNNIMDLDEIQLDAEMFNYIIDRKTPFTEDIRLMLDHEKLDRMLRYLESIDPILIEQI
jgi:hypothetical protein